MRKSRIPVDAQLVGRNQSLATAQGGDVRARHGRVDNSRRVSARLRMAYEGQDDGVMVGGVRGGRSGYRRSEERDSRQHRAK
jgi:hypothetical protein